LAEKFVPPSQGVWGTKFNYF